MKVGNRMKNGRREDRINARFEKMVAKVNKLEAENRRLKELLINAGICLLYTSPSPRDQRGSRMPSSA